MNIMTYECGKHRAGQKRLQYCRAYRGRWYTLYTNVEYRCPNDKK